MREHKNKENFENTFNNHTAGEFIFTQDLTESLSLLGTRLCYTKSLREDVEFSLKSVTEFYDGDLSCMIEADEKTWSMLGWYSRTNREMTIEYVCEFLKLFSCKCWTNEVPSGKDVISLDTTKLKESDPVEYRKFRKCGINSIMAVPCCHRPLRFLIVCNSKRYMMEERYLKSVSSLFLSWVTEWRLLEENREVHLQELIKKSNDVVINLFCNIEIHTKKGILTEREINSPKFCRVLVYLLLHRNSPMSSREISEELWFEEKSENQGDKVKSLISRFKKVFSKISEYPLIVSSAKGYQINPELNAITDMDTFEQFYSQARKETFFQKKIELYQKALALYKGDILPLDSMEHWLLAREVTYQRMHLEMYNELMKIYLGLKNLKSVKYYSWEMLKKNWANVDAYYWLVLYYKENETLFWGSWKRRILEMAEHNLLEDEYEELLSRLP